MRRNGAHPAEPAASRSRRRRLIPLVFATMATQSAIVVLAPIMVEVGDDLDQSISAVGQGRTVLAATAVGASLAIGPLIDRLGVRPLILWGASLAIAGAAITAAATGIVVFYSGHVMSGLGVAALLTAGFAGVAAFFGEGDAAWAMGYVVGAQSIAWIAGNPVIGLLTDAVSWRAAYAVPAAMALLALLAGLYAPDGDRIASADELDTPGGPAAVLADPSARAWALAELVAYSAWTAELTYAGAFYIQSYGTPESEVGFLLAVGSLAFMASTISTDRLTRRFGRKRLIVAGAVGMALMLAVILNVTPSVGFTLALFCVLALFAGVRSTGSSQLGLNQLPARPGSMMAARTTSAQLGYMVGALAGGVVLEIADFGALGFVLLAGMLFSALLIARVKDPLAARAA